MELNKHNEKLKINGKAGNKSKLIASSVGALKSSTTKFNK